MNTKKMSDEISGAFAGNIDISDSLADFEELEPVMPEKRARVITVCSGKGGTGKTQFTGNLGFAFAKMGHKVLLIDADLGLANLHLICGAKIKYNLYNLLEKQASIEDITVKLGPNISLITGGNGLDQIADLDQKDREYIVGQIATLEKDYDIILIDTGAGISQNVKMFFQFSPEIIVVLNPEVASITDAFAMIKVINKMRENSIVSLVVNRVASRFEASRVYNHLNGVSSKFLGRNLISLGFINEDKSLKYAISRKEPMIDCYPRSKYSKSIIDIRNMLMQKPHQSGKASFFSKLKELVAI